MTFATLDAIRRREDLDELMTIMCRVIKLEQGYAGYPTRVFRSNDRYPFDEDNVLGQYRE